MDWRKSSHSGANGGSCVEVAGAARVVLVRDTTDRDGQTLAFTAEAWRAFAEELKRRSALDSTRMPCPREPQASRSGGNGACP